MVHEWLTHIRGDFVSPAGYFFWGWLVVYGVVAIGRGKSFFPRDPGARASAAIDLQLYLLNHALWLLPLAVFLNEQAIAVRVGRRLADGLARWAPLGAGLGHPRWADVLYTIGLLAAADLGWTAQHVLFHRIPSLWELHKVHHAAPTLGLLTIARLHPIDALTQGLVAGLTVGVFTGLCRWALGYSPGVVTVLGASAAMGAFRVFGIFRHSPIGISFGPVVSHLLSSPAMHHIHHSRDPRHHDKNFGTVFSIWDRLLGTLYIPTETHGLRFGLDASERLRSLGGCLWAPLRESARAAIGAERAAPPIPLSGKSEPLY